MFKASDRTSVRSFARAVATAGSPELAEWLIDNGLFIVQEESAFVGIHNVFDMTHGAWLAFCMVTEIDSTGKNDMLANFFLAVVEHIIYGTDTKDADSIGGFSQREMDLIAERIANDSQAD